MSTIASGSVDDGRPILAVEDLRVDFPAARTQAVKGISFAVRPGECLALIGESGSGKSVTLRSLIGLAGQGAIVKARRLEFDGADTLAFSAARWRDVRGRRIGFVLQDALGSLDPLRPVGKEIAEPLRIHGQFNRAGRSARVLQLLEEVGVPEPELRATQIPSQLSGGLRQRALIASAIACHPDLLIADEPTTALDALVQAQVLDLLRKLRARGTALLLVSHDLGVAARLADRVAVMTDGQIVEQGPTAQVLHDPQHAYTRSLLRSARTVHGSEPRARRSPAVAGWQTQPEIEVRGVSKSFTGPDGKARPAVAGVSVSLHAGHTLGIVGGSGSGKTTLTRIILGLERADAGEILHRGRSWGGLDPVERRDVQVVFQDPLASFDPRYTVGTVLGEALSVAGHRARREKHARAVELLRLVRLDASLLTRRPIELSGGQRQRVAIARALAAEPGTLICDEPVAALDVSVQAQILELLDDLKRTLSLSCILISHDLGIIRRMSDDVVVMRAGEVVETGSAHEIFERPRHDYTRTLLAAIPGLEPSG